MEIKANKYVDLARKTKKLWKTKGKVRQVVIGVLGTILSGRGKRLKK